MKKLQTIDDVTRVSFKRFIARKQSLRRSVEENRQDRIRGKQPRHNLDHIPANTLLVMLA